MSVFSSFFSSSGSDSQLVTIYAIRIGELKRSMQIYRNLKNESHFSKESGILSLSPSSFTLGAFQMYQNRCAYGVIACNKRPLTMGDSATSSAQPDLTQKHQAAEKADMQLDQDTVSVSCTTVGYRGLETVQSVGCFTSLKWSFYFPFPAGDIALCLL